METHILLVEDDTMTRRSLAAMLERADYCVTQAEDGETALELLERAIKQGPHFDVVVTDVRMGAVDGITVVKAARSQENPPEVILLTASNAMETAIAALRAGAADYIMKPCSPDNLLERVQIAVQQHREHLRKAEGLRKIAEAVAQIQGQSVDNLGSVSLSRVATGTDRESEDASSSTEPAPSTSKQSAPNHTDRYIRAGKLWINHFSHKATFDNQPLHLTPIEYELLYCLAEAQGRVVSYADIVQRTHNHKVDNSEAYLLLKWHVRNLRRKIDPDYLVSVRGMGYRLANPEE